MRRQFWELEAVGSTPTTPIIAGRCDGRIEGSYPSVPRFDSGSRNSCCARLSARTPGSQLGKRGSIPLRSTILGGVAEWSSSELLTHRRGFDPRLPRSFGHRAAGCSVGPDKLDVRSSILRVSTHWRLAQLAECRVLAPEVAGSNPASPIMSASSDLDTRLQSAWMGLNSPRRLHLVRASSYAVS